MAETRKIDAVTTEIIRNGMVAATEEMKSNLMRTAYNMIIYEALDFTVGIFDRAGNTVSIGIGLPMFIRGMSNTVKRMIAHFGYDQIEDGDFAPLHAHGLNDEDIWDIAAITAFFGLSNRMASFSNMMPNPEFYLMGRVPKQK